MPAAPPLSMRRGAGYKESSEVPGPIADHRARLTAELASGLKASLSSAASRDGEQRRAELEAAKAALNEGL